MFKIFFYINELNDIQKENLNQLRNVNIIYRNYTETNIDPIIKKIKETCNENNRKFYIANNLKAALKFNSNGLYLPAFNSLLRYKNFSSRKDFKIIGSAHNQKEIKIKEKQGCEEIFITPIFIIIIFFLIIYTNFFL